MLKKRQKANSVPGLVNTILKNWQIRMGPDGTLANVDVSARTISINNAQHNQALAALAKAHWVDQQLTQPGGKDSFVNAFIKVMSSGKHAELARKYRKQRAMSDAAEAARGPSAGVKRKDEDDAGDMFAALVAYQQAGGQIPPELQDVLDGFVLRA